MINNGYCPVCRKYFTGKAPWAAKQRRNAVMAHIRGMVMSDSLRAPHMQLTYESGETVISGDND